MMDSKCHNPFMEFLNLITLGFGMFRVGRVGFLEVFGLRFHYLWGHSAFEETKRRFFIQNVE